MKKIITILLSVICINASAQNIGIGTNAPNTSALLDITSTNKGLLIPRMTLVQRNAITSPATGLMIYQTDNTAGFYYYNGSAWMAVSSGSGSSFTLPYYSIYSGASTAMQIDLAGNSNNTAFKTDVFNAGATGFLSTARGNNATAAVFTTANNSSATALRTDEGNVLLNTVSGFVGIGNKYPSVALSFDSSIGNKIALWGNGGAPHYGLGIQGSLLQMYTQSTTTDIAFGYGRSSSFTELMRIKGNGNVGVATNNPQNLFTVSANQVGISQQSTDATTKIGFYTVSGVAYLQTHTNHDLNFATNNGSSQMVLKTSGTVGIGTTTPSALNKLQVAGRVFSETLEVNSNVSGLGTLVNITNSGTGINTFMNGGSYGLWVSGASSVGINVDPVGTGEQAVVINKGRLRFKGNMSNGFAHGITYTNNAGTADRGFLGMYDDNQMGLYGFGGGGWGVLYNVNTGQLNIGASRNATGYKVNVGGKIIAEEVRVSLVSNWPDYVFTDDYKLSTLDKLDSYIKKNGHLPGIPAAAEIERNGLLLGDMQKKMMEKIEELTLYILQLKKENTAMQEDIQQLKKQQH